MAKNHSWFTNGCGDSRAGCLLVLIGFLTYGVNYSNQEKHVHGVDISLKNPEDGYFLKFRQHGPQTQQESLIITESTGELPVVQAQLGPFFSVKPIPRHLLDTSIYNGSNILDRFTLDSQDISVHLVSQKVTPESPKVQILIHAGVSTRETLANAKLNKQTQISGFHTWQNWCGQLFVQHFDQEVSGACILSDKYNGCVAGVQIPEEWWGSNDTVVHLYYRVTPISNNLECASTSNSIVPNKSSSNISVDEKRYLTTMPLLLDEEEFKDLKDKHVVISVPTGTYRPGAHFYVPIKLEANSDLQVFAMRARARNGLRILGATEISDSPWQIHVEISDRQKSATVTANLRESAPFVKRVWPQEVFHWMLQVDEHLSGFEVGRIIWSIEYEVDGKAQEHYFNPDPRFVSKINIQPLEEKKLIPVLKVTEIMNVAALTGQIQTYPLQIFVVNDEGNIHDVTWLTSCHSSNDNVLKVSKNCSFIYVDGKEKLGSRNVTVIAKSRQLVAFTHVTVWMPEERLNVQLSDNKLSQIKRWKTPKDGTAIRRKKREKNNHHSNAAEDPHRSMCRLRYQQTTVDVYASFCILENGKLQYYTGKKTYLRVTDLVKDRLRMSDPRIASLNGNIIVGQAPGLTEIQVLSPTGRVMAAKEIRVGHDKVSVQRLVVNIVSGINLEVREAALNDPTTILALLHVENKLKAKFQEAILDIALEFTDKTTVALKDISPVDYKLEVVSLNRQVIKVPRPFGLPYQPAIIATGSGEGPLLNVSLRLVHRCSRKNMHPLVSELTQVHVQFTKKQTYLDNLQSDGHYDNKVSDRWNKPAPKSSESVATIDVSAQNNNKIYLDKVKGGAKPITKDKRPQQIVSVEGYIDEDTAAPHAGPKSEPQLQQVVKAPRLSVLEIIMYVLLAVFCMAIIVFTVNCVVFTVRYRRKQMPKDTRSGTEPVTSARDWVWVGQATLERNAINTRCSQTLMPEEDFNGNQMRARLYSGTGSTGSSASASASSAASGGAGSGGGGNGGSGGGAGSSSNRNSTVSTYMGSECSIRITANPLPPEAATGSGNSSTDNATAPPEWDYEAMGLTYDQFKDYLDNLKESTA